MNERRRVCESKRRFTDRSEARRRRRYLAKRYGWPYRVYLCPFCSMYHLASKRGDGSAKLSGNGE